MGKVHSASHIIGLGYRWDIQVEISRMQFGSGEKERVLWLRLLHLSEVPGHRELHLYLTMS